MNEHEERLFHPLPHGDSPHYLYRIFFCDLPYTNFRHLPVRVHAGAEFFGQRTEMARSRMECSATRRVTFMERLPTAEVARTRVWCSKSAPPGMRPCCTPLPAVTMVAPPTQV